MTLQFIQIQRIKYKICKALHKSIQESIFLILHINICCGYSSEAHHHSIFSEHPMCFHGGEENTYIFWLKKSVLSTTMRRMTRLILLSIMIKNKKIFQIITQLNI